MCWVWCKWGEIREEKLRMILISGLGSWSLTWIIQLGKNFRSKVSSIWCGLYLRHMRHLSIKSRKKINMQIWISLYVFISMSCDWRAFLMAQLVKNLLAMWDTWAWSLVWEDTLEKGTATYSSILEWWIPWTVELMKSQRVRHNWVIFTHTHTNIHVIECTYQRRTITGEEEEQVEHEKQERANEAELQPTTANQSVQKKELLQRVMPREEIISSTGGHLWSWL